MSRARATGLHVEVGATGRRGARQAARVQINCCALSQLCRYLETHGHLSGVLPYLVLDLVVVAVVMVVRDAVHRYRDGRHNDGGRVVMVRGWVPVRRGVATGVGRGRVAVRCRWVAVRCRWVAVRGRRVACDSSGRERCRRRGEQLSV